MTEGITDEPREFRSREELEAILQQTLRERQSRAQVIEPERVCPDCGGERPTNASRCPACAERRRKKRARERQRRRRAKQREVLSRFCENDPLSDKGLQGGFSQGRVPGHSGDSGAQKRDTGASGVGS